MLITAKKNAPRIASALVWVACTAWAANTTTTGSSPSEENVTARDADQTTLDVITEEKPVFWSWYSEAGYQSEYNFRGVNLMPDSNGGGFIEAQVSKRNFTLGLYGIHQFGIARADAWSIGEGGGGGTGFFLSPGFGQSPTTVQRRFNEVDVFLQYSQTFGFVELTVGDIGFFIDRRAQTFLNVFKPQVSIVFGPFATVGDEQFDRLFLRVSTALIPHIQPWITYYQTIYNTGEDPFVHTASGSFRGMSFPHTFLGEERSAESYGGYLEARLRGNFPLNRWIDLNPYSRISYSFRDRSVPVSHPANNQDVLRGRPLTGWNNVECGVELPIQLFHGTGSSSTRWAAPEPRLSVVPFGAYSHHISMPTAGTQRDEIWGGAKFTLSF